MMHLDGHVHSVVDYANQQELVKAMNKGGFDGGLIFSHAPKSVSLPFGKEPPTNKERVETVLKYTNGHKYLFPFLFLDPTESDAMEQVETAAKQGIMGFKIICAKHFPCDERAMPVYKKIATLNKPILFHSGILYDGKNPSGNYNRPCNFEGLLGIEKLRFALAHVSWPWTDECLAVYGKFENYLHSSGDKNAAEMFIDTTPGTPPLYRRDIWKKIFFIGFDLKSNIIYGIDNGVAGGYDSDYANTIVNADKAIFREFLIEEDYWDHICNKNIFRFLGLSE